MLIQLIKRWIAYEILARTDSIQTQLPKPGDLVCVVTNGEAVPSAKLVTRAPHEFEVRYPYAHLSSMDWPKAKTTGGTLYAIKYTDPNWDGKDEFRQHLYRYEFVLQYQD